ncbi:MAG: putative hydrolase [Candidatus Saccharibacteria bacterium]|nr:putative hydrolase [Candidatus Saccharibacteria bacterium]
MQNNPWKVLSTKVVYENPWIKVHEDAVIRPDGNEGIYGFIESRDSVIVIVLNEHDEVYVIRNFSYPVSAWSWEFPGGGGDNQEPEVASKRELAEETGIIAEKWTFLGKKRVSNGLLSERMAIYVAQDLTFGERQRADDSEIITGGKFISIREALQMTLSGDIDDGQTITGLYLLEHWLADQKQA